MEDILRNELKQDEKLIWSGLPQQGLMLKSNDIFMIPFSLMWGGFAFYWEYSVLQLEAPGFFSLWGIPFVIAGLYVIIGRFFYDAKKRANVIYAVTNQRAIIISGLFGKKITSLNLKNIPEIQVKVNDDARGTITFGPANTMNFFQPAGFPGYAKPSPEFESIENVQMVHGYIQKYQNT